MNLMLNEILNKIHHTDCIELLKKIPELGASVSKGFMEYGK